MFDAHFRCFDSVIEFITTLMKMGPLMSEHIGEYCNQWIIDVLKKEVLTVKKVKSGVLIECE